MENSQNNGFLTGPNKMQIAVLDGKTIRKFIKHLKKLGATISINRPNHKNVTDSEGYRIFSALKYSNGWDCRVAEMFVNDLKNIIG